MNMDRGRLEHPVSIPTRESPFRRQASPFRSWDPFLEDFPPKPYRNSDIEQSRDLDHADGQVVTRSEESEESPPQGPSTTQPLDENDANTPEIPSTSLRRKLRRKDCSICDKEVAVNRFPKQPHGDVEHGRDACFDCWVRHLASQVDTKAWDAVYCVQCEKSLTGEDVKPLFRTKHTTISPLISVRTSIC